MWKTAVEVKDEEKQPKGKGLAVCEKRTASSFPFSQYGCVPKKRRARARESGRFRYLPAFVRHDAAPPLILSSRREWIALERGSCVSDMDMLELTYVKK